MRKESPRNITGKLKKVPSAIKGIWVFAVTPELRTIPNGLRLGLVGHLVGAKAKTIHKDWPVDHPGVPQSPKLATSFPIQDYNQSIMKSSQKIEQEAWELQVLMCLMKTVRQDA